MNYSVIRYVTGIVLCIEAVFMIIPGVLGIIFDEDASVAFFITAAVISVIGVLIALKKPADKKFYAKEGFVIVAFCWVIISIAGAFPYILSGEIKSFTDAVFESVSGFTTTGASVFSDVNEIPKCILFWRSLTQWLGGMGVVLLMLAIFPSAGAAGMYLMKAESTGVSVNKFVPGIKKTAIMLYKIYISMTILQIILLLIGQVPLYDTLCICFSTAGTGGFGIRNNSMTDYSVYVQVVVTIFMFLFGVNFKFYYLIICKKFKDAFKLEEVKAYFIIYIIAVVLITLNIMGDIGNLGNTLNTASFHVSSVITSTCLTTVDISAWPVFSQTILIILMFIGSCAGSASGGIKISRIMLYFKQAKSEISYIIHPRMVKSVKMDGKSVDNSTIRTANAFLMIYVFIFSISMLIICLDGFDLVTSFTSVLATFNNMGLGLGEIGVGGNFSIFSPLSKWVMVVTMLAGRLEIFPLVMLLAPTTWKK